jgi:hypothetical protein
VRGGKFVQLGWIVHLCAQDGPFEIRQWKRPMFDLPLGVAVIFDRSCRPTEPLDVLFAPGIAGEELPRPTLRTLFCPSDLSTKRTFSINYDYYYLRADQCALPWIVIVCFASVFARAIPSKKFSWLSRRQIRLSMSKAECSVWPSLREDTVRKVRFEVPLESTQWHEAR